MEKTGKIAVVGDKDSVAVFQAAGADVFKAANEFEAGDAVRKLVKEDYAVVFVTEDVAVMVSELLDKLKSRAYPVVIPIPSASGSNGFGLSGVKKDVEKAIGADILFNK